MCNLNQPELNQHRYSLCMQILETDEATDLIRELTHFDNWLIAHRENCAECTPSLLAAVRGSRHG